MPEPSPETIFVQGLYLASADALLAEVRKVPARADMLAVVGHNPGLQDFALRLAAGNSDAKAVAKLTEKFPTAGLARFVFEGTWKDLGAGEARLTHLLLPKDLQ